MSLHPSRAWTKGVSMWELPGIIKQQCPVVLWWWYGSARSGLWPIYVGSARSCRHHPGAIAYNRSLYLLPHKMSLRGSRARLTNNLCAALEQLPRCGNFSISVQRCPSSPWERSPDANWIDFSHRCWREYGPHSRKIPRDCYSSLEYRCSIAQLKKRFTLYIHRLRSCHSK